MTLEINKAGQLCSLIDTNVVAIFGAAVAVVAVAVGIILATIFVATDFRESKLFCVTKFRHTNIV